MLDAAGAVEVDTSYDWREVVKMGVNETHDRIHANVRANIRRQLPQVQQYTEQSRECMLLCGGPSLADHIDQIKRRRRRGQALITTNATHEWVQDHGMLPSAQIMVDARDLNAEFVARPVADCRYLIASQCSPKVFDALAGRDVHIWHGAAGEAEAKILNRYYGGRWTPIKGGGTVGTRALWLLLVLGYRRITVFGMDGCLRKGEHHAYPQSANDGQTVLDVRVGRRRFQANPWMIAQVNDLIEMMPHWPDSAELAFEGGGLIQHFINETARRGAPPAIKVTGGQ